jgi:hypothetical protein
MAAIFPYGKINKTQLNSNTLLFKGSWVKIHRKPFKEGPVCMDRSWIIITDQLFGGCFNGRKRTFKPCIRRSR